ncbi:MAG: DUF748 domain-containing protein [Cyclobacteriaceae bacterium]|nr:DUF748 domain-containing protein [Cyclobacteriaceae bacterium]MBX2956884.1 DUF748 domain-containing protein [Cyclobacteriaceae bacterium]
MNSVKKKRPFLRIVGIAILFILVTGATLLYFNFNRLLSKALIKSFESSLAADIYELKFENLRVNLVEGSIRVFDVSVQPRDIPLKNYPYINSSFRLTTKEITLENVEIRTLLKLNRLVLERISITKPFVEVNLNGKRHIILPFKDTVETTETKTTAGKEKLSAFYLKEFALIDASFHTINTHKQREFNSKDFTIRLQDVQISQQPAEYLAFVNNAVLSIGEFHGHLKTGSFQKIGFSDFKIGLDSVAVQLTLDSLQYHFRDFTTGLNNLDIQTVDSLFHVTLQSFELSYKEKHLKLKDISFKPNVSHATMQRKYTYQHTEFSGSIGTIDILQLNFDSLIYAKKLFVDEISIDNVRASIYKDKTKPMDSTRYPVYLGQTIGEIKMPLAIKKVNATNVHLENTERKPDGTLATVNISRASLSVKNISTLSSQSGLLMQADAWINNKVHFNTELEFLYNKPQFTFKGRLEQFKLPDLNPLIQAYTPAKINAGIAREISFSGVAEETKASGTMKFLYDSLEVDLQLHEQAKWKSAILAFAANTVLNNSNPVSSTAPPRVVRFEVQRDMNKGFVNVLIKSLLNGLKETMIMSKENRKTYKEEKKATKAENKNK